MKRTTNAPGLACGHTMCTPGSAECRTRDALAATPEAVGQLASDALAALATQCAWCGGRDGKHTSTTCRYRDLLQAPMHPTRRDLDQLDGPMLRPASPTRQRCECRPGYWCTSPGCRRNQPHGPRCTVAEPCVECRPTESDRPDPEGSSPT